MRAGKTPVATAMLLHGPGVTEVPSASSLRPYNPTCANMLLYWNLLERAIERGQAVFDFGRSTIDGPTYRFKKHWGARAEPAVWQYYRPGGEAAGGDDPRPENPHYQRLIRLWRQLPVSVSAGSAPPSSAASPERRCERATVRKRLTHRNLPRCFGQRLVTKPPGVPCDVPVVRSRHVPNLHPAHAGLPSPHAAPASPAGGAARIILSFDVEEHYRIEAAAGLTIAPEYKAHCCERLNVSTRWILERLARDGVRATFFVVGQVAEHSPALVRDVHRAGHEVASHSWDHRRVHHFTPETFREDLRRSKDALENVTGEAVAGYRAPTFSVRRDGLGYRRAG